ncbi:MAG: hypothetical protein CMI02_08000 [Oceanospirillaceae bacterium]|nr:hypothetical protein [Oceanospirillaceae bacterium]MBT11962.1 hypothetical protein [Oceanospirillaceae bacterium]|tara:strand:- start:82877 stop:84016 length:1140 start_codon:yes stop_codon:yes gene_type:complete
MASKCCLALSIAFFSVPLPALEALNEQALSEVTGQAQGLRYTSEFDASVDTISYIDDDGLDGGSVGEITLSPVRVYTQTNRPVQVDLEVRDVNGEKALVFTNRDLPVELEIASISINGDSLGGYGQGNFQIGSGDSVITYLYAGGHDGNGLTLDLDIPASMSYETWYEDEGTRLTTTVDFGDPYDSAGGGLFLDDISFDLESDGLRMGLPTTSGGNINFYNVRVGDDVLNSLALRNVALQSGSYLMIKNARGADEYGLEFDASIAAGSSLDFVYIAGEVDDNYLTSDIYELSASVSALSDLQVNGLRMNVDGERGLVFDFDSSEAGSGASANVLVENITMLRSDQVASIPDATRESLSIGTMDVQLNISDNSYLQVQGH